MADIYLNGSGRRIDYAKALKWSKKAGEYCEQVLGKEQPSTAIAYNNIAGVYDSQGDYSKALEWYAKAIPVLVLRFGLEHSNTNTVINNAWVTF